jgi:hypothetical protein
VEHCCFASLYILYLPRHIYILVYHPLEDRIHNESITHVEGHTTAQMILGDGAQILMEADTKSNRLLNAGLLTEAVIFIYRGGHVCSPRKIDLQRRAA